MKTSTKTPSFTVILAVLAFVLTPFLLSSCGDEPEPEKNTTEFNDGLATDIVTHLHKKGSDPCPQNFSVVAEVYCSTDINSPCIADSVVIENTSIGLEASFEGGRNDI